MLTCGGLDCSQISARQGERISGRTRPITIVYKEGKGGRFKTNLSYIYDKSRYNDNRIQKNPLVVVVLSVVGSGSGVVVLRGFSLSTMSVGLVPVVLGVMHLC